MVMDLSLFQEDSTGDIKSVIQSSDGEKFQKIFGILCVKRKEKEEKLEQEGAAAQDTERLELRDLVEEMRTFGVGEIEYQKWLVGEMKKTNTT